MMLVMMFLGCNISARVFGVFARRRASSVFMNSIFVSLLDVYVVCELYDECLKFILFKFNFVYNLCSLLFMKIIFVFLVFVLVFRRAFNSVIVSNVGVRKFVCKCCFCLLFVLMYVLDILKILVLLINMFNCFLCC